jgi:hypothetical protein
MPRKRSRPRVRIRPKGAIPKRLLVQIGRIATTSAYIEQEMILWASALFSTDTAGRPIEPLRMAFGRLRQKWFEKVVKTLDKKTVDKFIRPLNKSLTHAWPARGLVIHGRWRHVSGWKYQVSYWEQKKQLEHHSHVFTLRQVREIADGLDRILKILYRYFDSASPSPWRGKSRGHQRSNPARPTPTRIRLLRHPPA